MELKPGWHFAPPARRGRLLIEPLWNWNRRPLKPCDVVVALLIEPLWNWNNTRDRSSSPAPAPFNRTTMELKRPYVHSTWDHALSFNRTTMELKRGIGSSVFAKRCPFNRTTMELKRQLSVIWQRGFGLLLIEPLWNWNEYQHKISKEELDHF